MNTTCVLVPGAEMFPDKEILPAVIAGVLIVPATDRFVRVPTLVIFGCRAEAADRRPVRLPLTLILPAPNDVGVLKLVKLLPSPYR